ncbi:cobalt-precorrin-5B (C(1))-methyltransferase CbiD [Sedimentibacter sp. MB31-C6]|uniref:cobalt-precorrin-5B (C(1))-methyltransferase CbiD n=1 Tax=Sedimentibacter sp. MB31-C6 TaxID=3109366 RepID=UPI002DDDB7BD|nr:cobalt-precorrin-5B (C(1))-methyltransferase CbiD [Sedimentibacter sp. MB36-C1]WSI04528.1 cobalt-precorrin-5B (C(1))-methyltransferase CbiD [Sedimentibacter sp. MB36-C1]
MKEFIIKNGKKLRCGYTTGTCATAAAVAAARMIFSGEIVNKVYVQLPNENKVLIEIIDPTFDCQGVSCCVKKDSGDDPDVTDGILIFAKIKLDETGKISIDGGEGVGRVTQKGLDCPVGSAAINSVPRKMIIDNLRQVCREYKYDGGISVIISAPDGKEVAKKTFNPHLGIKGGISIIGTTGIVEPMSEKALVESLKVEMRVIKEKGYNELLAFPGNYAQSFIDKSLGIRGENSLKFSNYLGEVLDYAIELNFNEILIVGHIGKMVKVAGGMMNTHSNNGDFRMEILSCYAALYGVGKEVIKEILSCITTEQVVEILIRENIENKVLSKIRERAEFYINKRVDNKLKIKLIIYSNNFGILD